MPDGQLYNENNDSFMSSLDAIYPHSNSDTVKILWTTILASWFPANKSFILAIKTNPDSDSATLILKQISKNAAHSDEDTGSRRFVERHILMLVCKTPSEDSPAAGWQECTNSDRPLVKMEIARITSTGTGMDNTADGRLYTALAIGTRVKFFRWSGRGAQQQQQFEELHSGILNLRTKDDRVDVEAALAEVGRNGWDWAR